VSLSVIDTDRYGRKVAEVRLPNGTLIQKILISEGLAVVYNRYIKDCASAAIIKQAEVTAKQQRAGIWSDAQFVLPSEWRHNNK